MQILITAEIPVPCEHRCCALSLLLTIIAEMHTEKPLTANNNILEDIKNKTYIEINYTEPNEHKYHTHNTH